MYSNEFYVISELFSIWFILEEPDEGTRMESYVEKIEI